MFDMMKGYKIPTRSAPRPLTKDTYSSFRPVFNRGRKVRYFISLIFWIPNKICYYLSNRIFNRLTSQIWIDTGEWW